MITSATPEQWAKIDQIRQDCIDQQTEPISSEDCRKAVEDMWESLGKKKPQVVQVDGPYAMLSAFYALHLPKVDEHRGDIGRFQLATGLDLNGQVGNSLATHIDAVLHDKLYASLMQQLSTRLESVVSGELNKLFSGDIPEIVEKLNSALTFDLWNTQRETAQNQLNEPDYAKLSDKIPGDEQINLDYVVKAQIAARLGEVTSSSSDQVVDQVGHRTVADLSSRFLAKLREIQGQLSQLVLEQVEKMSASASAIDDNDVDKLRHSLTSQIYSQTGGTIYIDSINRLFSPLVESLFGQLDNQIQGAIDLHNNPLVDEKGDDFTGQVYDQLSSEDADKLDQHSFNSLDASINQQLDEQIKEAVEQQLDTQINAAVENSRQIYENKLSFELSSEALGQLKNSLIDSLDERLFSRLKDALSTQLDVELSSAVLAIEQELEDRVFDQLSKRIAAKFAEKVDTVTLLTRFSRQLSKQIEDSVNEINEKFRKALYSSVWWRAWSGWYDGAAVLGVQFNQANLDLFQRWCRFCPLVFPGESTVIVCRNPVAISWKDGLLHNDAGPSVEFADGFKVYTIEGIAVDEQIVMAPETQTIQQIEQDDNADRKAIRIARYGWPRYLKGIGAVQLDRRHNELEGTKEALFSLPDGETKLVVTCPTGRVFTMGVGEDPGHIKTCEEAQKWIHRGRVMLSRT